MAAPVSNGAAPNGVPNGAPPAFTIPTTDDVKEQKQEQKQEQKNQLLVPSTEIERQESLVALADSKAYSTLKLFHDMGLGGDDTEDIFEGGLPSMNGQMTAQQMHDQIFMMEQQLMSGMPPLREDGSFSMGANGQQQPVVLTANGAAARDNINNNMQMNGNNVPKVPIYGSAAAEALARAGLPPPGAGPQPMQSKQFKAQQMMQDFMKAQDGDIFANIPGGDAHGNYGNNLMVNNDNLMGNTNPMNPLMNMITPQRTTPRRQHDVSDMDGYKEITKADLDQFDAMLTNTETLIKDMLDVCNYNGYGLNPIVEKTEQQSKEYDKYEEMTLKEQALTQSIDLYNDYVDKQMTQYNFNLSSNAIVDLIGVPHMMTFEMADKQYPNEQTKQCYIDKNGFVLFKGKRLTPHFYFSILDGRTRHHIDRIIQKAIRDYLRKGHFGMEEWYYPTKQMLKGITPILMGHFELQTKIFYLRPLSINARRTSQRMNAPFKANKYQKSRTKSIVRDLTDNFTLNPNGLTIQDKMGQNYCVIIFPNHKTHLKLGLWSRSVTYFDNAIRGTMFNLIEQCKDNHGFGVVLLNPNERQIESDSFDTKNKYNEEKINEIMDNPNVDDLADILNEYSKDTETITLPRNESSAAHTISMWKHFILPQVIKEWHCKLLLLSHCNGGDDIINLLETQADCHEHIIGIAMLDYYNWSLSQFSKATKQIIEQRAAIYMSLHGSNESAYGFEPSAAKSAVTIFRTANKEKRYAPCYNTESVIRFFRSKIELHKKNIKN